MKNFDAKALLLAIIITPMIIGAIYLAGLLVYKEWTTPEKPFITVTEIPMEKLPSKEYKLDNWHTVTVFELDNHQYIKSDKGLVHSESCPCKPKK